MSLHTSPDVKTARGGEKHGSTLYYQTDYFLSPCRSGVFPQLKSKHGDIILAQHTQKKDIASGGGLYPTRQQAEVEAQLTNKCPWWRHCVFTSLFLVCDASCFFLCAPICGGLSVSASLFFFFSRFLNTAKVYFLF